MSEVVPCYRFVEDDLRSQNGDTQWVVGEWQKQEGGLSLCENGFHACLIPYDSLNNIYGSRWFRAEARGRILHGDGKFCASEMRLVSEIPSKVIHQWAVDCAYRVLHLYEEKYPDDRRPRAALEAAQAWIDSPTEENREKWAAARAAARAAAWAAAWAAADAARAAADAAWDAARAAARAAAWAAARAAARAAAGSAEEMWQRQHLNKLINAVKPEASR